MSPIRVSNNPRESWSIIFTVSPILKRITRPIAEKGGWSRRARSAIWCDLPENLAVVLPVLVASDAESIRYASSMVQRMAVLRTGPDRAGGSVPAEIAAGVAELADALDLGSSDVNRGGSNPPARTMARSGGGYVSITTGSASCK